MSLELKNLSVNYGETPVIHDLTLSLGGDEILMLVGPTGCGKTTILRALAGIVPLSGGEISMGEIKINREHSLPPEKRNVGMVFQDFALFPHLNVEENIGFRLRDKAEVDHWIQTLRLGPWRWARPETLSGGQKQRVALARTLAHKPGLILLDEPLSNLDAALKDSLRWTIRGALKEAGVPAVWVTHDQDEAMSVGDRVGILNRGKLEQLDTPETCFSRPSTRFVADFLGEASFLPAKLQGKQAETELGTVPVIGVSGENGDEHELLVRPDDISLSCNGEPNARVSWSRFEGGSRLYGVELKTAKELKVRVNHEVEFQIGDPVRVEIAANHPLVAF